MLLCALLPGADAWHRNQVEVSRAFNFGMQPNQKGRQPSPYSRNFRTRSPSKKDARAINSGSIQLHLRMPEDGSAPWALACSEYGERFVCAVRQGQCVATQFHPEKSGTASGLKWQLGQERKHNSLCTPIQAQAIPRDQLNVGTFSTVSVSLLAECCSTQLNVRLHFHAGVELPCLYHG